MVLTEENRRVLDQLPTGNIADNNNSVPHQGTMDAGIKPIDPKSHMVGRAVTVQCYPGDNLALHQGIYAANAGDVLVFDCHGYTGAGHFGDIMALACKVRGIAGVIIDGSCRDAEDIRELGLGIGGAALATALFQLLSAVLCVLYLKIKYPALMFGKKDCTLSRHLIMKTARYSLGAGLHQTGLYIGKMIVQGAVNTGGTAMIAAYTAAGRIEGFANSFGDSGSAATSVLTGHSYGAGDRKRTQRVFRVSLYYMLLLGAVCSVIMYFTRNQTSAFLLSSGRGAAFDYAVSYIRLISLFYIFCFTGNSFAGFYEGTGHIMTTVAGACSHIAFRAMISCIFVRKYGLDVVAIATGFGWIGVNIFWSVRISQSQK